MGKKSSKTTNKTVYGNTTTTNPYVTSTSTNKGTTSLFNPGSAFGTVNNFVNQNMEGLLDQYINPSLNTVTNQAKMNSFMDTLNKQTKNNIENNIINPLSNRNMIRSSQATNLYNNLARENAGQISNYANELLANSQSDTASMLSTLMLLYMNGYNVLSDTQKQSLAASQGNATKTQKSSDASITASEALNTAMQLAMIVTGLKSIGGTKK